ncbi:MAG: hypothetical protein IKT00_13150 [Prevotella sp.]|nr:hypothetical protein [Prevotella sp.]
MKKLFFVLLLMMACTATFAQTSNEDYFIGNWTLSVEGLPTGDKEMLLIILKNEEGQLEGGFGRMDGSEFAELTDIIIKDNSLQVFFDVKGFHVSMNLSRKDDGTVTGSIMDMFDCKATKIEEKKE